MGVERYGQPLRNVNAAFGSVASIDCSGSSASVSSSSAVSLRLIERNARPEFKHIQ